jgi:glycosyltransferase involved in cell wall biosynthesis
MTTNADDRPLLSIGVPTYNRAAVLERAVSSALAQTYGRIEVIVSDNASSDATEAVGRNLSARDSRVRYLRQTENCGLLQNFRRVLVEARGELFMWLADDDWIDPAYATACIEALSVRPDCGLACGIDRYYDKDVLVRSGTPMNLDDNSPQDRVISYFQQVILNGVFYGIMRRELLLRVPLTITYGIDWLMMASMAFLGKVVTVDSVSLHRSYAGESMDMERTARRYGLTPFQANNPFLTVATLAFKDLAWQSPVYASLSRSERLLLGTRAFNAIVPRFYSRGHLLSLLPPARPLVRGVRRVRAMLRS